MRASKSLPLGVTSSFQHWDPYPISIASARGAWLTDVDDRQLLDLSMGFGAMLRRPPQPDVVRDGHPGAGGDRHAVRDAVADGDRRWPSGSSSASGSTRLRFTNSGTESTMYAVRTARAFTGTHGIVKIEGGYHGGYDALSVSVKPARRRGRSGGLPDAGRAVRRRGRHRLRRALQRPRSTARQILAEHADEIARVVMEPVLENIGIVLPDEGYLAGVRAACDQHGVLLIFDEVKTGLTAGYGGASRRLGVTPDLVTLAKSIGGGLPLAAFGGREEVMAAVTDGRMAHFGTYNGNPLVMAAAARGRRGLHRGGARGGRAGQRRRPRAIDAIIARYELPAHTVGFGVKGAVTWSTTPVRNYRDYKRTDFGVAELQLAVGRQPRHPHPARTRRAVAGVAGAHQRRHGPLVEDFGELAQALRA